MAASTVSKDSEGIYTEIVSPDKDVYSTLDHTSPNCPRDQHQGCKTPPESLGTVEPGSTTSSRLPAGPRTPFRENSAGNSHPYRRAAVCLGLLCFLLLAAASVLCVLYTSLSENYSLMERDLEELRARNSTMIQERDLLQRNYTRQRTERDQLQKENSIFQQAVLKKFPFIDQYCPYRSQKRECKPCPQGWELFDSKCYYFSTERKIWTQSRNDCIKRGADLVIIESKGEQDFISKNIIYYYHWIGLSDTITEGTWLWVDGSPLQRGFWRSKEPDDRYWSYGVKWYQGADCALFVDSENTWKDNYCNWAYSFICETDALLL